MNRLIWRGAGGSLGSSTGEDSRRLNPVLNPKRGPVRFGVCQQERFGRIPCQLSRISTKPLRTLHPNGLIHGLVLIEPHCGCGVRTPRPPLVGCRGRELPRHAPLLSATRKVRLDSRIAGRKRIRLTESQCYVVCPPPLKAWHSPPHRVDEAVEVNTAVKLASTVRNGVSKRVVC